MKFNKNRSKGSGDMERTLKCYRWNDRRNWTDEQLQGWQGSINPLVCSYLRVPQAAGQVKIWMISNVN